jgi:hypothetical protein
MFHYLKRNSKLISAAAVAIAVAAAALTPPGQALAHEVGVRIGFIKMDITPEMKEQLQRDGTIVLDGVTIETNKNLDHSEHPGTSGTLQLNERSGEIKIESSPGSSGDVTIKQGTITLP